MANIINQIQVGETPHDIQASAIFYGEVDSTSTSTAYTATIPNLTTLIDGTTIMLRNGVVTSASGFTININGLGAKPVYNNMTTGNDVTPTAPTRDTTIFNINYTMLLTYVESDIVEGGCWICYRGYNSDNNTIGYQLRTNSTAMPTITRTRYYRLLFTSADHIHWVPANTTYDNSATSKKTVNPNAIDPFGRIVYMTGTTNVNAGSNVSATVVWSRYTLALGYSFNTTGAALTLTYPAPVYVQCTPAADGSATMEGYVQSLPNTNNGKIYIFLGMAYSATNIELYDIHPVYWYDGNGIKLWTGVDTSQFITDADIPEGASKYTSAPANVATAAVTGTSNAFAPGDHVHAINSNTIINALGFTPYSAANPNNYTSNTGTVTGVKINNNTKAPSSGVVDLGTVLTTYTYTLPTASTTTLGGIKIGSGLSVSATTGVVSAAVYSVNSKTGSVSLTAADVGALPSSTVVPTQTSQLQNNSGFLTSAVTSLNSKTGAITITAGNNVTVSATTNTITISATDTTYSDFVGTDSDEWGVGEDGVAGLVPAPPAGAKKAFLYGDGQWHGTWLAWDNNNHSISGMYNDGTQNTGWGSAVIPLASTATPGLIDPNDQAKLNYLSTASLWYGTCNTVTATANKEITLSSSYWPLTTYTLKTGNIINVYFNYPNTTTTPTINVNSTGAKPIRIGSAAPNGTDNQLMWDAGTLMSFIYDETGDSGRGAYRYLTSVTYGTAYTQEYTTAEINALTLETPAGISSISNAAGVSF